MKTVCIPASSGPGRRRALEATRSSNPVALHRSGGVSVASADSNWNTPAVAPLPQELVHLRVVERQRVHVHVTAGPRGDLSNRSWDHGERLETEHVPS